MIRCARSSHDAARAALDAFVDHRSSSSADALASRTIPSAMPGASSSVTTPASESATTRACSRQSVTRSGRP